MMDKKISEFIKEQKNLTMCTSVQNQPWCANCFYAFMEKEAMLVFKSDRSTNHITQALLNDKVAGTIVPDLYKTGTIKGIQFTGRFIAPETELLEAAKKKYYKKFPFAAAVDGEIWIIELFRIKMTDNTLGFGKKINWEKEA